jgi:hypothetical protein
MERRRADMDARNRLEQITREDRQRKKEQEKKDKEAAKPPADCYVSGSKWTKQHLSHLRIEFEDAQQWLPCLKESKILPDPARRLEKSVYDCLETSVHLPEAQSHHSMFSKAGQTQLGPFLAFLAMTRQSWPFVEDGTSMSTTASQPKDESSESNENSHVSRLKGNELEEEYVSSREEEDQLARLQGELRLDELAGKGPEEEIVALPHSESDNALERFKTPTRFPNIPTTVSEQTPQQKAQEIKKPEIVANVMIILFLQAVLESSRQNLKLLRSKDLGSHGCHLEWFLLPTTLHINTATIKCDAINDGSLFCKSRRGSGWTNMSDLVYCSVEVSKP